MIDAAPDKPLMISVREACGLLNIARSTYFQLRDAGRIGPEEIKLGRKILIRKAELTDWITAGCPARNQWKWKAGRG